MVNLNSNFGPTFIFLLLPLLLQFHSGKSDLQLNYYRDSCPRAEKIIKEQAELNYYKHKNIAISSLRILFHDCIVGGCDASLLLETANGVNSEKNMSRNFGLRDFKYIAKTKEALEKECPMTVSCADIVALSARDGAFLLGGLNIEMKTGRKDSMESHVASVDESIPDINATMSSVLSTFGSIGIDAEGTVALIGAHSVGRVHCVSIVPRLYPKVDPTLNSTYAEYLIDRCPNPTPDPKAVEYARNDLVTPYVLDNNYYKKILENKGLLVVDQELADDETTYPFVQKMAVDNDYFLVQFARAISILSETNPLTGDQGEIRKNCRFVNTN